METYKDKVDMQRLPRHIAVIMDGNGRWAKERGKERIYGHYHGVEAVRSITTAATEMGIKFLTLYTFSTENWNRPKEEVDGLMELLVGQLVKELPLFQRNNIRLLVIGDCSMMPSSVVAKLEETIAATAGNSGLTLVLALSYSSRWEITDAVRRTVRKALDGGLDPDAIDTGAVAASLATGRLGIPDPELLIRTSGELRLSNFLLWQLAYTELYFADTYWPDFREDDLYRAIADYQQRERRFGKTSEQL